MSQGQKAADEIKGGFKAIGDLGEGIRKNVNSFADNLADGKTHESTGFSSDAKAAGEQVNKGLENAGKTGNVTTGTTYTKDTSGSH
ncbi:uncharacterized protein RCC_05820 [Ramularia collo-cygni]|uniref:Uncharacterized protein n=1 Tax=Ramularia collo-cygni TaxID=112498 RepID=A0A2D3VGX2_9PEZI|nr:uncharacterized protein RCC_05820 [Ramularia collo-cygni]CZT19963.1 uncharacterized protein RCC_05820 [Ramularia collo-cygni]